MSKKTYQFEVLRTGDFTDANGQKVTITDANLNELASSYDPENAPAPLVLGHPKDNGPAHGWIDSLKVVGNKLLAFTERVHDDLVNAVQKGLYKKISLSIFNPDSPSNPVPGGMYVRHAGFLGSTAPAVTGLAPLSFNEDVTDVLELEFSAPEKSLTERIKNILAELLPDFKGKQSPQFSEPNNEEDDMSDEEKDRIAQLEADLAAEKKKTKTLTTDLAAQSAEQRKTEINSFCDQMVEKGKLAPALKDMWVELMTAFPETEIEFSEGSKTLFEKAKSLLEHQAKILDFTEKSSADKEPKSPVNFSAPSGQTVESDDLDLLAQAESYAKKHDVSFEEAARAVGA